MEVEYSTAFYLLLIGMITVFVVLTLVVWAGNLLIRIVNRFSPEQDEIAPSKIAAITTAVNAFTQGRGQITKIEKL